MWIRLTLYMDNYMQNPQIIQGENLEPARATILRSKGIPLTKIFRVVKGKIEVVPYGNAKHFDSIPIESNNIAELTSSLGEFSKHDDVCVINAPSYQEYTNIRRTKENFPESPNGTRWAVLDFDGIDPGNDVDPNSEEAIEILIKRLPPEFQNVSYFYQFSSSAGILNPDGTPLKQGINVHLFFVFENPIRLGVLKKYLKDFCLKTGFTVTQKGEEVPAVDLATFSSVQPIYICHPRIEGDLP
jgi:hypothetical protein